jgi:hypothetical protein
VNKTDYICISSFVFYLVFPSCTIHARSPFRTPDPLLPRIAVSWDTGGTTYTLADSHLEEYPYFKLFDEDFLRQHAIPKGAIEYRYNPTQSVTGNQLVTQIQEVIGELATKKKKKQLTHFTVIQEKDFNRKKGVGLIVLKFKDYPFIVKLFIDTPEHFVRPFEKGFEPIFFFFMGGGVSRHLSGFTRIKNLHIVRQKLQAFPKWAEYVDFPRKWYWMPENAQWIKIVGTHIGPHKTQEIKIPGTYAVIADYIYAERPLSLHNRLDRQTALDLCNDVHQLIDLHLDNFLIEKDTKKFIVIDTEHFPSFVGFTEKRTFNSYTHWYTSLMGKAVKSIYGRTKKERRQAQFNKRSEMFLT